MCLILEQFASTQVPGQSQLQRPYLGCENTALSPHSTQDGSSPQQLEKPRMSAVITLHSEWTYKRKEPCQGRERKQNSVFFFKSSKIVLFEF